MRILLACADESLLKQTKRLMQASNELELVGCTSNGTKAWEMIRQKTPDMVVLDTDLPYAAIHNDGGEIVVTGKMKRYFWYKYYEATGSFGRKKNGQRRNDKRTRQLSTEADFWRFMALKRAGTTIRIPRRRFLGTGPEVERIVREIIEDNLNEYFNMDFSIERK